MRAAPGRACGGPPGDRAEIAARRCHFRPRRGPTSVAEQGEFRVNCRCRTAAPSSGRAACHVQGRVAEPARARFGGLLLRQQRSPHLLHLLERRRRSTLGNSRSRLSSASTSARRHHQPREPFVVGRAPRTRAPLRGWCRGSCPRRRPCTCPNSLRSATSPSVELPALGRARPGARAAACAAPPWRRAGRTSARRVPLRARWRSKPRMSSKRSFQMSLPTSSSAASAAPEYSRMHAHHQHLLVVRAIEDADAAARRQAHGGAPQEIVIELLGARRLERMHLAALRIEPAHHVLDDAVLAGGVHAPAAPPAPPSGHGRRGAPAGRRAARCPRPASSWLRPCRDRARRCRPDRSTRAGSGRDRRCGSA